MSRLLTMRRRTARPPAGGGGGGPVYAGSFDGNGDYATAADSTSLRSPSSALTIAGFVSFATATQDAYATVVSKSTGGAPSYSSWSLFGSNSSAGARQPVGIVTNGGDSYQTTIPTSYSYGGLTPAMAAGTWYLVAMTWVASGAATMRVLNPADGTVYATGTVGTHPAGGISYTGSPFYIGGIGGEDTNGRLMRWGVHNAALSLAQLQTWATTGTPPVTMSAGYWLSDNSWTDAHQGNTLTPTGNSTLVEVLDVPWT